MSRDGAWFDVPTYDGYLVYALWGAENEHVPLYVGQSTALLGRISGHLNDPHKQGRIARVTARRCESKTDMDNVEQALITAYCPPFNRDGLPTALRQVDWGAGGRARHDAERLRRYEAEGWLTALQVAERLRRSVKEINALVANGSLRSTVAARWTGRRFRPAWVGDLLIDRPDLLPQPLGRLEWFTAAEAADYLKISGRALRAAYLDEDLKVARPARGDVRFRREWLDEYKVNAARRARQRAREIRVAIGAAS